jgi:hypothetical protein
MFECWSRGGTANDANSTLMEDGNNTIASKVQELSDLELAALLCFVAEQHCCIIEADPTDLDNVQEEIKLVRESLYLYFSKNLD